MGEVCDLCVMWCVCVCVFMCVSECVHALLTYVLEWAADAASLCSARRWRFSIICSTPTPSARRSALSCNVWPISTQRRIYVIPFIHRVFTMKPFFIRSSEFYRSTIKCMHLCLIIVRGYMHSITLT